MQVEIDTALAEPLGIEHTRVAGHARVDAANHQLVFPEGSKGVLEASIYSIDGRLLYRPLRIAKGALYARLPSLQPGVYIVRLSGAQPESLKFVVREHP